ncbi:MAG TPA: fibronectin type III domain-containing protein, partial [Tepidisphaeraceae bacterium]
MVQKHSPSHTARILRLHSAVKPLLETLERRLLLSALPISDDIADLTAVTSRGTIVSTDSTSPSALQFPFASGQPKDQATQPDGKRLVAGYSSGNWAVARYNPDNSLDPTFGNGDGKSVNDLGTASDRALNISLRPDGKIILLGVTAGSGDNWQFAAIRLNPDGTLDSSFATNGKLLSGLGRAPTYGGVTTVLKDGRIHITGYDGAQSRALEYDANGKNPFDRLANLPPKPTALQAQSLTRSSSPTTFARLAGSPFVGPIPLFDIQPLTAQEIHPVDQGAPYRLDLLEKHGNGWDITWNDTGTASSHLPGSPLSASHTYATPGERTITATTDSLFLRAGKSYQIPQSHKLLHLDHLNIKSDGKHPLAALDLKDNDLVVEHGSYHAIDFLRWQGYRDNTADPNAVGIISTAGQTLPGNPILALFDNAVLNSGEWPWGSGHTVGASAILGQLAYIGDADLSGMVSVDDYQAIDSNLGQTVSTEAGMNWFAGDWNFDGQITPDDYTAVGSNLGIGETSYHLQTTGVIPHAETITQPITVNPATLPDAPTNVAITNVTGTSLTLTWNAPATGAAGYRIYQQQPGQNPQLIATLDSSARSYNVTTLSQSTTYNFQVRSTNTSGHESANPHTSGGGGSGSTASVTTPNEPASDFVLVYDGNAAVGDSGVTANWSPQAPEQPNGYRGYGNGNVRLNITGLPRHTHLRLKIDSGMWGPVADAENVNLTVKAAGAQLESNHGIIEYPHPMMTMPWAAGNPVDEAEGFKHSGSSLEVTVNISGMPNGWLWNPAGVRVETFLPRVEIAGGSGYESQSQPSKVHVVRSGTGSLLSEELTVPIYVSGTATRVTDYGFPTAVTLPSGANSVDVDFKILDDYLIEGDEYADLKLLNGSSYLVQRGASDEARVWISDDDGAFDPDHVPPVIPPDAGGPTRPNDPPLWDPPGGAGPGDNPHGPDSPDGTDKGDTVVGDPPGTDQGDAAAAAPASGDAVVAAAPSPHRVDIHGVPLPSASPTGDGESDRVPNTASIDAFSLLPTFGMTEIAVPMPGGELLMEFRRTMMADSEIHYPYAQRFQNLHWASENVLGKGWSTNLGARVIFTEEPKPDGTAIKRTATVVDDAGNSYNYFWNDNYGFLPDVRSNFSNAAMRGKLEAVRDPVTDKPQFVFTGRFGTKLYYSRVGTVYRSTATFAPNDTYYRLERVVDRNGNELRYAYEHTNKTLITAIYDPKLYNPALYNPSNSQDGNPQGNRRRIRFQYMPIAGGYRLTSAEDPLGRVYHYEYATEGVLNGQLMAVRKPAVRQPTGGMIEPRIKFDYDITVGPHLVLKSDGSDPWDSGASIKWYLPKTIDDARRAAAESDGNRTSFAYAFRWVPTSVRRKDDHLVVMSEQKPRLTRVSTADGDVVLDESYHGLTGAATSITDSAGHTTSYNFTGSVIPAWTDLRFAFTMSEVRRTSTVTDANGAHSTKTVTYKYSNDINANLTEVTDMSGNKIRFEYGSDDPGDPYNQPGFFGPGFGTHYAIYDQPSRRIMDYGEGRLNLATDYRYDTTFNKLKQQIDAAGIITEYTLDEHGNRIEEIAAKNTSAQTTTHYDYDRDKSTDGVQADGFLYGTTDPDGRQTQYLPDVYGNVAYTIVKAGPGEDLTPLDNVKHYVNIQTSDKDLVSYREADIMGRTKAQYDGRGVSAVLGTKNVYDNWDRVTDVQYPAVPRPSDNQLVRPTTHTDYDFNSNPIEQSDQNGHVTITQYDAFNRPTLTRRRMLSDAADDASDLVTHRTYDHVGNLTTETDAKGNVTTHRYDELLREIETDLPPVSVFADAASTDVDPPAGSQKQYTVLRYYGENSGSGAFTLGGFNPTRIVSGGKNGAGGGFATDSVFDSAYRQVRTVQRRDDGAGVQSIDPARLAAFNLPAEPETITRYNVAGKPIAVTIKNEQGGVAADRTSYTFYDELGRVTASVIDMDGNGISVDPAEHYLESGAPLVLNDEAIVTRTEYDDAGHTVAAVDGNGSKTTTDYDSAGRAIKTHLPSVQGSFFALNLPNISGSALITETVYDAASNPIRSRDANGTWTQTQYDALNRPVRTIVDRNRDNTFDPTQGPTAAVADVASFTGYDLAGNKIYSIDPNGNRTDTHFDFNNRADSVQGAAVKDALAGDAMVRPTTVTHYDRNGNVVEIIAPHGSNDPAIVTQTEYDQLNRPWKVKANSSGARSTEPVVTETRYDSRGNKLAVVLFNKVGDVAQPQVTTYTYDAFGRQTSETLPSVGDGHVRTTTTTYDRAGEPIRVVDPKGQRVETTYDRAGRTVETAFYTAVGNDLEESRVSTYDRNGNLLSRTDKNGTSSYTYDALNRQITESRNTPGPDGHYTINNFYDGVSNRTKVEYPNQQGNPGTGRLIVSTYDGANRVTSIGDNSGGGVLRTTTFGYDAAGNRLWQVTPQDLMTSATFDALNRVITLGSSMNAGNNDNFYYITYHYDLAGQRRSADELLRAHANRHIVWDYDALDRLTSESWTCSGEMDFDQTDQTRSYTYDLAGNRLTQTIDTTPTGGDVVTTSYTYDALNELKSSVTGNVTTSYKYDINGNRSEKNGAEGVLDYLYDTSDRLIKVRRGANTIFTASYDARTRRLSKIEGGTTTLFRYDGGT